MSRFTRPTIGFAAAAALSLTLAGCAGGEGDDENTLSVGATAMPAAELLRFVADELAPDAGLTINIQEYSDYNTPNPALSDGTNDANLFQHEPFLLMYNDNADDDLTAVGPVYLPPLALYSQTVDSIDDLPDGASIALPNDPSNESRALLLLADAGLIEVNDNPSTVSDITANPRNFRFDEVEAASLPQALQEKDASIVNFSFAAPAGLSSELQILTEGLDSRYFNVLATRAELADDPRIETLYELLTSEEAAAWLEEAYDGLVIPAE
ncbi:MetQ/NlpA family ABC transporter substrate-binding protein [Microbacterium amylolyticum]|uniref:Lipoprotein n=1 Tax=Microbacterium amylolyticum TaxID=936337 RepID=A0ABS4ZKB5_9MICO|nr:MetQ/NlpA family ABC transporter substrate-binding protein [Microbacterium amylolyticum]MBP2437729.1 D-methionine transport system substrate-binding protein [Microbacterium amylolyticum]